MSLDFSPLWDAVKSWRLQEVHFNVRMHLICFTCRTLGLYCLRNYSLQYFDPPAKKKRRHKPRPAEKAYNQSFLRWTSRFQNDLCDQLESVGSLLFKWLYATWWAWVGSATANISPVSHVAAEKLKSSIGWVQLNLRENLPRCPSGKWENRANTTFIPTWGRLNGEPNISSPFAKACVKDISSPTMFCMHAEGDAT